MIKILLFFLITTNCLANNFEDFTKTLRCTVCQNQTLYDSNTPIATALKKEIQLRMDNNESEEEIKNFLISRYGDFILYSPPVRRDTIPLWFTPIIFFIFSFFIFFRFIKND